MVLDTTAAVNITRGNNDYPEENGVCAVPRRDVLVNGRHGRSDACYRTGVENRSESTHYVGAKSRRKPLL